MLTCVMIGSHHQSELLYLVNKTNKSSLYSVIRVRGRKTTRAVFLEEICHIFDALLTESEQMGLREDDYTSGYLGSKLQIERISARLHCTILDEKILFVLC